jgi:hypothetical protein
MTRKPQGEYRGFTLLTDRWGRWWATAGGGFLNLGPYNTEQEAREAVDWELDGEPAA